MLFLFFFFYFFPSVALEETNISLVYDLLNNQSFYQTASFQGEKGMTLHYAKFGKGRGEKGSLVFVSGRAENLFKYIELFYDLHLKGWSPIYTYDHRGQGFSDHFFPNSTSGHVEDYIHYRRDLKTFLNILKKDPEVDTKNLFLIAHSMGGTIVIDYLQSYDNPIFKACVFSSPMFHIKLSRSSLFFHSQKYLSLLYCTLFSCKQEFSKKNNEKNVLTDSKIRGDFFTYLQTEKFPQTEIRLPSHRWIIESIKIFHRLMREERIKKIKSPILILQGEKDFVVSNNYQNKFCEKTAQCCQLKKLAGKHDLFLEKDKIRNQAIAEILKFFSQNAKNQKICSQR